MVNDGRHHWWIGIINHHELGLSTTIIRIPTPCWSDVQTLLVVKHCSLLEACMVINQLSTMIKCGHQPPSTRKGGLRGWWFIVQVLLSEAVLVLRCEPNYPTFAVQRTGERSAWGRTALMTAANFAPVTSLGCNLRRRTAGSSPAAVCAPRLRAEDQRLPIRLLTRKWSTSCDLAQYQYPQANLFCWWSHQVS